MPPPTHPPQQPSRPSPAMSFYPPSPPCSPVVPGSTPLGSPPPPPAMPLPLHHSARVPLSLGSGGGSVTQELPRVPQGQLPYTLSLSATMNSPYGITRVHSNCALTPLHYTAGDHTAAQVSLAEGHQFDRDVELLVYYEEVHRPSALLESRKAGVEPGSFMGDPVVLLTLYPSFPTTALGPGNTGEFLFLVDRSGSMECNTGSKPESPQRIHSAKETLILLLKSLPLGCYFNIYGFGSEYDSFYPESVEYTQQTMTDALQRVKQLEADLGGTEILAPLQAIYRQPCREGHPRQLFVFTDGEVFNTDAVIAEVQRHGGSHRCFSFGIGEGASTALIKGIARVGGGSAEFITGQDRMQVKALQSLKRALQPAATGISVHWSLPLGVEAGLLGPEPKVIFQGQRCLLYARLRGQQQPPGPAEGTVTLQYSIKDQSFTETLTFPLQPQEEARLPIHRLAAQAELQELEWSGTEDDQRRALETSLISGVLCAQTAYVGVDMELGQPIQGPLARRNIPLAEMQIVGASSFLCVPVHSVSPMACFSAPMKQYNCQYRRMAKVQCREFFNSSADAVCDYDTAYASEDSSLCVELKDSPYLSLVSLQNADGSWVLDATLTALLGPSEAEATGKMPAQVSPGVWATVLAVLWLHAHAAEQQDEWQLLETKALGWLRANAGPHLAECVGAANSLLGCSVSPRIFDL
uniref:VWFA domain-containing protein n=1 Tax=Sphenodon punctatus TaxID=8508 RepID=A0A8D0L9T1_SPHPU